MSDVAEKQNLAILISPVSSDNEDLTTDNSGPIRLVPYEINSDSETDSSYPEKSKERSKRSHIKKPNWFAEKNKKLREAGKQYLGRRKADYEVPKKRRIMKARCNCKQTKYGTLKCQTFTEDERRYIFKNFWKMNWKEKKVFVEGLVTSLPVKRNRGTKPDQESRRHHSFIYHLKKQEERIKVCRTMFLNTLGIGRWTVLNWKNEQIRSKRLSNVVTPSPSSVTENVSSTRCSKDRQELDRFFNSLPIMESHYCRSTSKKTYLQPEWQTKMSLYQFYKKDWCKSRDVRSLSIAAFYNAFDAKNLALFIPKKDQCEKCSLFKVGSLPETEYLEHQQKKEEARREKEKDKSSINVVFTVDLQAVLMAPKSKISSLYYRTKLQVHNLTFYNIKDRNGYCFLWNETEGGLGSEEFASIWVNLIEDVILPKSDSSEEFRIIFYSDGCNYQNRNCVMSNALLSTAIKYKIIIEQKFLEVGHTQMEADCIHSTIERALKNKDIYVPADYVEVCKSARKKPKPYEVNYLSYSFFKKFDTVQFFKSIRPGRNKGDAKVTDIRALQYKPNGEVFFKLRYSDDWQKLPQKISSEIIPKSFSQLPNLYVNRRKITAKKFDDLQYLKRSLPEDYRSFYDNLPHE